MAFLLINGRRGGYGCSIFADGLSSLSTTLLRTEGLLSVYFPFQRNDKKDMES